MIVKAYDPQGDEVFPEREFLGDTYEKVARSCAQGIGAFSDVMPKAAHAPRRKAPRRRKAATSATGPAEPEGGGA